MVVVVVVAQGLLTLAVVLLDSLAAAVAVLVGATAAREHHVLRADVPVAVLAFRERGPVAAAALDFM
jgi:hypothetical protein